MKFGGIPFGLEILMSDLSLGCLRQEICNLFLSSYMKVVLRHPQDSFPVVLLLHFYVLVAHAMLCGHCYSSLLSIVIGDLRNGKNISNI